MSRILELVEQLKEYDEKYFDADISNVIIDDSLYDNLRNNLRLLDPGNEYFSGVGSDVRGGKVPLPYQMGSLNQVYDDKDLDNWRKARKIKRLVVSDKLDGCSISLIYRDNKFVEAYSRGNGREGADVTRNVNHIQNLIKDVECKYLAIRAEVILKTSIFEAKYTEEFKNPRNMVAGIMNRKIPTVEILNDFDIVVYEILDGYPKMSKEEEFEFLKNLGFSVVPYSVKSEDFLIDSLLGNFLLERKLESEYLLDGLVLTDSNYKNVNNLSESDSLNPEHSVKYKNLSADAYKHVSVVDVLWELSKHGYYKPRVQIFPTEMCGTTVTYATGFNGAFIRDNGIGPGSVIEIVKAGEVIPYIVKVVTPTVAKMPEDDYVWNDSNVEAMVSDPDNNPNVKFKQILSFFETLKIDLFREATLRTIFEKYHLYTKTYEENLTLIIDLLEPEWVKVIGANGKKIYASLHSKLSNLPPEEYLGALKYFGVGFGKRKAKMLLSQCENGISSISGLTEDDVVNMSRFDTITARAFIAGVKPALSLLEALGTAVNLVEKKAVSADLAQLNVVLTGFRDEALQNFIEMNGGKVSSGVSKKTTHLICATIDSGSSKYKKAKELGVKVMTVEDFKNEYL